METNENSLHQTQGDSDLDGVSQKMNLTGFEQDTLRIGATYKRSDNSSGYSGKIKFGLYVRWVYYSSTFNGCTPGDYPASGTNENVREYQSSWMWVWTWRVFPHPDWLTKNSDNDQGKKYVVPGDPDAVDTKLTIRSTVTDGSDDYVHIYLDDVRIEQRNDG